MCVYNVDEIDFMLPIAKHAARDSFIVAKSFWNFIFMPSICIPPQLIIKTFNFYWTIVKIKMYTPVVNFMIILRAAFAEKYKAKL